MTVAQHTLTAVVLAAAVLGTPAYTRVVNGFDLSNSLVPKHQIREGGAPRDGIPALTDPAREPAQLADTWLEEKDRVIGLALNGEAVAYPIRILNWHEVVNDIVGETPVVITYCPLCGTGVVFDALMGGKRTFFGVSGLLYNSDVLLFDRHTESLFSQLLFEAITGPLRGTELRTIPASTTTWKVWKSLHPDTQALSRVQPPYLVDYGTDPYALYRRSRLTMFPVRGDDPSRGRKEWAYLILAGEEKILVAEEVLRVAAEAGNQRHTLESGILLEYNPEARQLLVWDSLAGQATVIPGYWFALTAFHPKARRVELDDLQAMTSTPSP